MRAGRGRYNAGVTSVPEVLEGAGHVPIGTDGPTIFAQSAYFLYFTLDLARRGAAAGRGRRNGRAGRAPAGARLEVSCRRAGMTPARR